MSHFPDTPAFTGFNTPSRIEADILDLAHQGTIPPALDAAFLRVQPRTGSAVPSTPTPRFMAAGCTR